MSSNLARQIVALVLAEAGVRLNAEVRELAAENVDALLSPSDTKRLAELRKVAHMALEWFAGFPHQGNASAFDLATAGEVYGELQRLLNHPRL